MSISRLIAVAVVGGALGALMLKAGWGNVGYLVSIAFGYLTGPLTRKDEHP